MPFLVIFLLIIEAFFALFLLWREGHCDKLSKLLIGCVFIGAAFVLRGALFNYETLDYQDFLHRWVEYYRENSGFAALKNSYGNYNIPYLYFIALFSYSSIKDLYLIKLLSCFFDVVLAYSVMKLASHLTSSKTRQLVAFIVTLFLPTVILNGALWAQCDSIYVSLGLLGVAYALEDRPVRSMVFMALSFGFKLQAVFLLPIIAVLWFYRKYSFKHFFIFPLSYILLVMPAVLIGRPFMSAIMLYFNQAGTVGKGLNYNSPSVFAFFWRLDESKHVLAANLGIIAAFTLVIIVLALAYFLQERLNERAVIFSLLIFCIGIPFLLPHMHDRYFFAADVLSVAVAVFIPELAFLIAIPVQFASFLAYYAYLNMRYLLYVDRGAKALILALVSAFICLFLSFSKKIKKFEKKC